jgi:hypothetical protein
LEDWPTLRVALLDYLAQRDGEAAGALALSLLETRPLEAGEWTLALREVVRGRVAETWPELVTRRVHEFLGDPAWARDGAPSWLEGFDVVVAGRDPVYLRDLSEVATGGESRAARFAAFLAADRLVLAEPAMTLAALNREPALFAGEPNVRAGLFARADVRRPEQLVELERYLARPDLSDRERTGFTGLFPLYDLAVSNNLLTPPGSRTMADMLAHDRAAIAQIDRWIAAGRFPSWHDGLRATARRLRSQVAETDGG